tara:strand:+ start:1178 stop:1885 length:708 start_codon:yes stop_codon:yes gene_type:complete
MSNKYFSNFPEIQYTLNSGKIITIKDFFRKSIIERESVNSYIEYAKYEILDGERPDAIASKLYGDSQLHWTFFLVNELENYYDWHMDTETFNNYIEEMFDGQTLTATEISDIITSDSKFLVGERITSSTGTIGNVLEVDGAGKRLTVSGLFSTGDVVTGSRSGKSFTVQSVVDHKDDVAYYENADGIKRNYAGSGWNQVSHYDDEWTKNESRRIIKIIKPERIKRVVSEFERVMS